MDATVGGLGVCDCEPLVGWCTAIEMITKSDDGAKNNRQVRGGTYGGDSDGEAFSDLLYLCYTLLEAVSVGEAAKSARMR